MISDEPDEDADALDDETLLETYTSGDPPGPRSGSVTTPDVRDWPPRHEASDTGSGIGAGTLAWFKENRIGWRGELDLVLRARIAGHTEPPPDAQPSD